MEDVMKAVILAGGLGTRLAEETDIRPKPMVQVGERPILWLTNGAASWQYLGASGTNFGVVA
jgi:glucose-1-phosphate cytidylyltransferase